MGLKICFLLLSSKGKQEEALDGTIKANVFVVVGRKQNQNYKLNHNWGVRESCSFREKMHTKSKWRGGGGNH